LELLKSHDHELSRSRTLTIGDLVEIRKQSALDEAEGPEPEPRDRIVTVFKLNGVNRLNENGIKMFENSE
jgi:hypothetical protein